MGVGDGGGGGGGEGGGEVKTRVGIEELLDFRRKGVSSVHAVRTCIPTDAWQTPACGEWHVWRMHWEN